MKPEKYQALFEEVEEWLAGDYTKRHQTERLIRWMKVMVSGTIKTCCKSHILFVNLC